MKCSPWAIYLSVLFATTVLGEEYQINLRADGEDAAIIDLTIELGVAVAKTGKTREVFDLTDLRWLDDNTGKWVSLTQSQKWAEESKAKSLGNSDSIPANVRAFVLWALDPTFTVKSADGSLILSSDQVTYHIKGKKTTENLTDYFRYARLNAYKKAMTERKLPPFAELKAIDEMEKSGLQPTSIQVEILGIEDAPKLEIVIVAKDRSKKNVPATAAKRAEPVISEDLAKDIQAVIAMIPSSERHHVENYLRNGPAAKGDSFVTASLAKNALNGGIERDRRISMPLARTLARLAQGPDFGDDAREYAFIKLARMAQRNKEVALVTTPLAEELAKREKDLLKDRAVEYLKK